MEMESPRSAEQAIGENLLRPTLNSTLLKPIMNPLTSGQISAPLNYCLPDFAPRSRQH